jgi:hypothetical protein
VTAAVWVLALSWAVGYCCLRGYQHHAPDSWLVRSGLAINRTPEDFRHFWGIPDWVWVGILLPWLLCTAFTVAFSRWGMKDDELGAEGDALRNAEPAGGRPAPDPPRSKGEG